MEKSFSVIISDLRKEKHLTQKEAASRLGISQALLSHYEKGIRECGKDFLITVADFYGVSCDYLLGRTDERKGETGVDVNKAIQGDYELSTDTIERACLAIKEALDADSADKINLIFAAELYRFILMGINAGYLPEKWACCGEKPFSGAYLNMLSAVTQDYASKIKGSSSAARRRTVPPCIETLAGAVTAFLQQSIENMPFEL